jgi:hypothetical protein
MENLRKFRPWREWVREGRGGALLATPGAVEWFVRQHRARLVAEGVLLQRRGRGGHLVDAERFGEVALQIAREEV